MMMVTCTCYITAVKNLIDDNDGDLSYHGRIQYNKWWWWLVISRWYTIQYMMMVTCYITAVYNIINDDGDLSADRWWWGLVVYNIIDDDGDLSYHGCIQYNRWWWWLVILRQYTI
jgi:hypothetical protein